MNLEQARTLALTGVIPGHAELPPRPRRAVDLAGEIGAPLVPALDAAIAAERDGRRRERTVAVATAQARAVLAALAALPPLAVVGTGALLGEDLWRFYLEPPGTYVLIVGAGLFAAGLVLAHHLVRRATAPRAPESGAGGALLAAGAVALLTRPAFGLAAGIVVAWWRRRAGSEPAPPPGSDEIADLTATALLGGLTPAGALRAVADVLPSAETLPRALRRAALAHDLGTTVPLPPGVDDVDEVLRTASTHGAPAAPALRRLGEELRERELARAVAAAERLPALLAFPTALFLLPSSVLLVGAPLLALGLAEAGGGIR